MNTGLIVSRVLENYVPIEYDKNGSPSTFFKADNADELIAQLQNQLISPYSELPNEEQEKTIFKFYMKHFESGKFPTLSDLCEDIEDYNSDIIWHIAEIDFANDCSENYWETIEEEGIENIDIDDTIREIYNSWQCNLYDEQFCHMSSWVAEILNEIKCFYLEEEDSRAYLCFKMNPNIKLIYNECQNVINPEWFKEGAAYIEPFVTDFEKVQVVTV